MTHHFDLEIKYQLAVTSKIYGSDLQFVNEKVSGIYVMKMHFMCNEKLPFFFFWESE